MPGQDDETRQVDLPEDDAADGSDGQLLSGALAAPGEPVSGRSFRLFNTDIPARPLSPALYLVATPIGNLGDMTIRGLETLAAADIVLCEDTRVSRVLLDRFGIRTRPYPLHDHNEAGMSERIVDAIAGGKSVALISDAGTPLVSDPGYRLARATIQAGQKVVPVPGASAPLAALSGSGLPSDAFLFAGFLPQKDKARRDRLAELRDVPATLIFFESPHRIGDTLAAAVDVLGGGRGAAVCRELTKTFEDFRRDTLSALSLAMPPKTPMKGEIVLVIGPPEVEAPPAADDIDDLLAKLLADMPVSRAATEASRITGLARKDLYRRLLDLKGTDESEAP